MRKRGVALLGLALVLGAASASAERPDIWGTKTKTATATSAQTDTALWTPASGKRVALQGCVISATKAMQVELEVSDVDVVPPIYFDSYGRLTIGGDSTLLYVGDPDAVLTYSTTNSGHSGSHGSVSIACWGYEVQ